MIALFILLAFACFTVAAFMVSTALGVFTLGLVFLYVVVGLVLAQKKTE